MLKQTAGDCNGSSFDTVNGGNRDENTCTEDVPLRASGAVHLVTAAAAHNSSANERASPCRRFCTSCAARPQRSPITNICVADRVQNDDKKRASGAFWHVRGAAESTPHECCSEHRRQRDGTRHIPIDNSWGSVRWNRNTQISRWAPHQVAGNTLYAVRMEGRLRRAGWDRQFPLFFFSFFRVVASECPTQRPYGTTRSRSRRRRRTRSRSRRRKK